MDNQGIISGIAKHRIDGGHVRPHSLGPSDTCPNRRQDASLGLERVIFVTAADPPTSGTADHRRSIAP